MVEVDPKDIIKIPKTLNYEPVEPDEPNKTIKTRKKLHLGLREALILLLQDFKEIFAWVPRDMPGIPAEITLHR